MLLRWPLLSAGQPRHGALEGNRVETLDRNRQALEDESCLSGVSGYFRQAATHLGDEGETLSVERAKGLQGYRDEGVPPL